MQKVAIWEETVMIPTYAPGEPDKNPMFLDSRVYQGSSGRIYPYPTTESIADTKEDRPYQAIFLENDYIKVMVLPELGGRIQRAYDKTNGYDFVYYNHVIKPALVGLTGPWISGGIEFNWPQHHRPTTFLPVDWKLEEHEDGSKSVLLNDTDRMYGTKGIMRFTVYPDKAYIEIKGQLYNPTPLPQTFLWWANPAVAVNDHTQSVFPPDVHAVMDHGKRDVSRFPIATGVYYKHDYSEGVDISRYKNIPVPTSYMAEKSDYDFVGGYDYGKHAGILHVADHHISPGKKQWTWGCGDFGKTWDRNLTDEDGPYIELMTGVYTDNQPDFSWLAPFEEKTFTQVFMPYKEVGQVKNASLQAVLGCSFTEGTEKIIVYGPQTCETATLRVSVKGKVIYSETVKISPNDIVHRIVETGATAESDVLVEVLNGERVLTSYQAAKPSVHPLPEPAQAAEDPEKIASVEELYLTGLHIEQYRHATYLPDPYYLEGLKRDPGDLRCNNAYGLLLLRRGQFEKSESYFRAAIKRATWKNPNPCDSEPYYNLGLSLYYQGREDEAYDAFYKSIWTAGQQERGFYYLAVLSARRNDLEQAEDFARRSLSRNTGNVKARGLLAWILCASGKTEAAKSQIDDNLRHDPFDYVSRYVGCRMEESHDELKELQRLMRDFEGNYRDTARAFAEFAAWKEAGEILDLFLKIDRSRPMVWYEKAYYSRKRGKEGPADEALFEGASADSAWCFPNRLSEISVLAHAIEHNSEDAKAPYYLGCLWYDKRQYKEALACFEESTRRDSGFAPAWRCLSLLYFNQLDRKEEALTAMETAFRLNPSDARVFFELDQLYIRFGRSAQERKGDFNRAGELMEKRDDLMVAYVTILNTLGEYEKALDLMENRRFHPWEGGEGKISAQYREALSAMARKAFAEGRFKEAENLLLRAFELPENLGEGKLEGTKENDLRYLLGLTLEAEGRNEEARECFLAASEGADEPAGVLFYNDQPADMIYYQGLAREKLGQTREANARFWRLIDYGEQHLFDTVRIPYFAVSLPDFVVFNDDLTKRNQVHCRYLIGLGMLGLGRYEEAEKSFAEALALDPTDIRVLKYSKLVPKH